jgi:integrase
MAKEKEKDFPGILIKRGRIWHYQLYLPGRGLWKRTTGKSNYQQAVAEARRLHALAQLLSESQEELPILSKAIVREVARIAEQTSERQAERVGIQLANFLAWAGDLALEKISTEMLDRYQRYRIHCRKTVTLRDGTKKPARCGATVSANTVKKEVISIAHLLRENGFPIIRPAALKGTAQHGRPFEKQDLQRFFSASARYPPEEPGKYTPLFLLLLATGARPAELVPSRQSLHVALLKRELDSENSTVTIRSAKVHRGRRGKVTKIQIAKPVMDAVLEVAEKTPGVHVFPPYQIWKAFNAIAKLAGLSKLDELGEKLTAHSFRHTFGTILAEQGANAFIIQNVMRHSDPRMTSRYTERAKAPMVIDVSEFLNQQDGEKGPAASRADPGK